MTGCVMYVPSASGGHARYASELLTALTKVGGCRFRVCLVTSRNLADEFRSVDYPIHSVLEPLQVGSFPSRLHWFGSRLIHYYRRELSFFQWIRERRDIEVVHFQEYCPLLAPLHFARLRALGKRLFYTVHNIRPHRRSAGTAGVDALSRRAWRLCDGLFVHSEGLKHELESFLGAGHPPVHVTPHGVWSVSARFEKEDPARRVERRQLLCFGAIRRNKGFHVLLDALADLPGYRVCIAGAPQDGRYASELVARVKALPPERAELVLEFIDADHLETLFAASSAVVLPYTEFAAQSGVLHDALAFSTPVVVSGVGALRESVAATGIGEVVPPYDSRALGEAIQRLHQPERYAQVVHAVQSERERLSWTSTADRTLSAYAKGVA